PVIGRPSARASGVPAGDDPRIGPGPKGDAIGHSAGFLPSAFNSVSVAVLHFQRWHILNRRHGTDRGPKKTHDIAELGPPSAANKTGENCCRCRDALGTIRDALRLDHAASSSILAILAGVPDPVISRGAAGQACDRERVGVRSSAMPTATAFPALLLAGFGRAPRAALALAVGVPVGFAVAFLAAVTRPQSSFEPIGGSADRAAPA